jgi:hypothetical protein
MSVGHLLNDGLELKGNFSSLEFSAGTSSTGQLLLQFKPHCPGQNIYWISARLTSRHSILAMSSVTTTLCIGASPILIRMFCDMH